MSSLVGSLDIHRITASIHVPRLSNITKIFMGNTGQPPLCLKPIARSFFPRKLILLFFSFFFFFFFHLTYSRWTSSLPSCLWSQRIFPSLPGSRLTIFYRDASSALLQLVNQWLNFSYSRSRAFRCERKNTNPTLVRIELTTSTLLADAQLTY